MAKVVDLGPQPAADYFPMADTPGDDPRWPLELWLCERCALAQLGPVEQLAPEPALAIESDASRMHSEASVKELLRLYPEVADATVAEYGSHHHGGSWLSHLKQAGCRVADDDEPADLVIDIHGVIHEPGTGDALRTRAERLKPGGLLVLEFHHLLSLVRGNQFDMIRHGHWSYLSLTALSRLASDYDLEIIGLRRVSIYGGSLQAMLQHRTHAVHPTPAVADLLAEEQAAGIMHPPALQAVHHSAMRSARALHDVLADHSSSSRSVLGYGAPSKAPVLLGISDVGPALLPFAVDRAPGKHGRRIPGCGIPIRPVSELVNARPDVVVILTWDIADEVVSQLEADGGWGATYIVPLPEPHVIER